jgi:hypothetical protein
VAAHPCCRPERINAFAQYLERYHCNTRRLPFMLHVPLQRNGIDAVLSSQLLRPHAHGVDDDIGMISPEESEHRLHRGVVADVA